MFIVLLYIKCSKNITNSNETFYSQMNPLCLKVLELKRWQTCSKFAWRRRLLRQMWPCNRRPLPRRVTHTHTQCRHSHTYTHTGTATVSIAVELPCWVRCVSAPTSSLCPFPCPVLSCWRLIIYAETRFQRPLICPLWIETVRRDRRTDGQLLIYILPETS